MATKVTTKPTTPSTAPGTASKTAYTFTGTDGKSYTATPTGTTTAAQEAAVKGNSNYTAASAAVQQEPAQQPTPLPTTPKAPPAVQSVPPPVTQQAPATQGTIPSAVPGGATTGTIPGATPGGTATADTASKYTQGFKTQQTTGQSAPQDAGSARSAITKTLPPEPTNTSAIDTQMAADKGYQSLLQKEKEYNSLETKQTSMVDFYKQLTKQAGLPELNTELVNLKNVINGTEDDIRSEVTAANGFATDSQVQALAASRNKTLIKQYNTFLDTYNEQKDYVNTMVGLAGQDRQAAQQTLQNRLQFSQMENQYREKFVSNAQESYKNTISAIGYDGLYNSLKNDPYTMGLAEQVLGMTQGQLSQAATTAATKRAKQDSMDNLDIKYKTAEISNINSQIKERNNPSNSEGTLNGKPQNASQSAANSYANRLAESNIIIDNIGGKFTGKLSQVPLPNVLKSGDRQSYEQAQNNFVTAVLRRESGASIAPSEFQTARDIYFPKPGDTPATVAQKAATRNTVINNFYHEANMARPVMPGQIIESDGKRYKVGVDGESLTAL